MSYLGQKQDLDWTSPSRIFATTTELFDSQPNYEHEVAIVLDTGIKYQGSAPIVGGWAFATGVPIVPPAVTPAVNDSFTKVLLEFDGKQGSTTYPDTNAAGWPHAWVTGGFEGFGGTTNVGEKFPLGALRLDGNTYITAKDENRFDLADHDFTIRGWFTAEMPMGDYRTLFGKTDDAVVEFVFWCDRTDQGFFNVGVDTVEIIDHFMLDRFGNQIFDRQGEFIITRFTPPGLNNLHFLESTTIYTDTINPGWHSFVFRRRGPLLELLMDGVVEDTDDIGVEVVNQLPGPLTIGGYSPNQNFPGFTPPWIGMVDRLAVDIGIGR